jgi:hypothetical protein
MRSRAGLWTVVVEIALLALDVAPCISLKVFSYRGLLVP